MVLLPNPFGTIPFHQLGYNHPSPVHHLPGLSQRINNASRNANPVSIQFWAKREDQAGPLACYGNKYRKFEYIVPDILKDGNITTIVTEGAVQSNHTVQVASLARVLGLKCHLLLHRGVGGLRAAADQEAYIHVGNVLVNRILGADVQITTETDTGDQNGPLVPILDDLKKAGEKPYWISSGASLHPLGGLGYARCAFEIASQEEQLLSENQMASKFDYIFVACGSGSSLAGLIAGFKLLQKKKGYAAPHVIGVLTSPTKPKSYHESRILRLARMTGDLIGLDSVNDLTSADVHIDDSSVGDGYGILDSKSSQALEFAASTDSLLLDPVYTAKVMNGMLAWAETQRDQALTDPSTISDRQAINVLFIHTGGQTALSAYADVWTAPNP